MANHKTGFVLFNERTRQYARRLTEFDQCEPWEHTVHLHEAYIFAAKESAEQLKSLNGELYHYFEIRTIGFIDGKY
jgi:hypothetical protein